MNITIIQPDVVWESKPANFRNLDQLISKIPDKTDLIILPEMFNTGFSMNPSRISESSESETFVWMKQTAINKNIGICGSYSVKEEGMFFNRWVFISGQNEFYTYDKRHLFSMGGEDKVFTAGKSRVIFTFRGVRISPYICYDLRFPVWSRNTDDYDLAIYSSNWPEVRGEVWNILLKARAIENQCYVAGSNRIGVDGNGIKYNGGSLIIGPKGEILKAAAPEEECSITSEIQMQALIDFRKKFPVLKDSDSFNITT